MVLGQEGRWIKFGKWGMCSLTLRLVGFGKFLFIKNCRIDRKNPSRSAKALQVMHGLDVLWEAVYRRRWEGCASWKFYCAAKRYHTSSSCRANYWLWDVMRLGYLVSSRAKPAWALRDLQGAYYTSALYHTS